MSKTSLNAINGIELKALVPFKISLPMNWDILGPFSPINCPNAIKYPKNRTTEPSVDYFRL